MPYQNQTNKIKIFSLCFLKLIPYAILIPLGVVILIYLINITWHIPEHINTQNISYLFIIGIIFWTIFEIIINKFLFNIKNALAGIYHDIQYLKYIHYQEYNNNSASKFLPVYHSFIILIIMCYFFYTAIGYGSFIVFLGFEISYFIYYKIIYQYTTLHSNLIYIIKTK